MSCEASDPTHCCSTLSRGLQVGSGVCCYVAAGWGAGSMRRPTWGAGPGIYTGCGPEYLMARLRRHAQVVACRAIDKTTRRGLGGPGKQATAESRCRSSVVEHSLGKGEVESSIPSGSTIFPRLPRSAFS